MTITNQTWRRARLGLGAAGILAAILATAPSALADSVEATAQDNTVTLSASDPSATVELPAGQLAEASVPAAEPAAATPAATTPAAATDSATASATQLPANVQHLSSPENLPPGTTSDAPSQGKMDYLRYLWNAMRSQDVTPGNALLLLAQRPMAADADAPSGVATTPSGPVGSSAPAGATVGTPAG